VSSIVQEPGDSRSVPDGRSSLVISWPVRRLRAAARLADGGGNGGSSGYPPSRVIPSMMALPSSAQLPPFRPLAAVVVHGVEREPFELAGRTGKVKPQRWHPARGWRLSASQSGMS